jgi:hypothetical protein
VMRPAYVFAGRVGVMLLLTWSIVCLCRPSAPPHVRTLGNQTSRPTAHPTAKMVSLLEPPTTTISAPSPSIATQRDRHWPAFESLVAGSSLRRLKPPLVRLMERNDTSTPNATNEDVIATTYRGQYGWRFKEYVSSALESTFYDDMRQQLLAPSNARHAEYPVERYHSSIMGLLAMSAGRVFPNEMPADHSKFLERCDLDDETGGRDVSPAQCLEPFTPPTAENASSHGNTSLLSEYLSRFVYTFDCLGEPCDPADFPFVTGWALGETHTTWIEPLFGAMRHPKFLLDGGKRTYLEDKGYMVPDKWALHNLHTRYRRRFPSLLRSDRGHCVPSSRGTCPPTLEDRRESLFVDMGASTYGAGTGGASQNWFVAAADCLCVPFTDMFLFEAKKHKSSSVWRHVPDAIHPAYHWYNYPLNASLASWRNPLNHLLTKVHPNDVVTVKVDFDTPELEAQIIDTILRFPELYQTIDELFFEHHVTMPYMNQYWREKAAGLTVVDSIDLFRSLRRKGIRAHSWV